MTFHLGKWRIQATAINSLLVLEKYDTHCGNLETKNTCFVPNKALFAEIEVKSCLQGSDIYAQCTLLKHTTAIQC